MTQKVIKIILIFLLVIFQLAFFNKLSIFGSIFNMILIFSLIMVLFDRIQDALLIAVLGGLLLDLASPMRFGVYTFATCSIILIVNFLVLRLLPTPNPVLVFLIFFGAFLFLNLLVFLFSKNFSIIQGLIDSIINGLMGILMYFIFDKILTKKEEIKFS